MRSLLADIPCTWTVLDFIVTSPIGDIKISSCQSGLHNVYPCENNNSTFSPDERRPVLLKPGNQECILEDCGPANECYNWLKVYFTEKVASTDLPPLCSSILKKDSFCANVLDLLPKAAPMGTTVSYKDLARLCGNEQASRAAGNIIAANPVALLIPCHRVITSAGTPGNYDHGKRSETKIWLLKFEQEAQVKCA